MFAAFIIDTLLVMSLFTSWAVAQEKQQKVLFKC